MVVWLETQYVYEKKWHKVSEQQILHLIAQEMPQADPQGTMVYILAEVKKGKIVTLGECRFRQYNQDL